MELLSQRALVALCLLSVACIPKLDIDEATVREPRVLAIIAEPAESAPTQQQNIHYTSLVADANGVRPDLNLAWFDCLAQKPLAELGPISRECLKNDSDKLVALGTGGAIDGKLPMNACSLFGPNPPQPMPGQPPGRPVDPDQSGGYKVPLIIGLNTEVNNQVVLYEQRISCGIANVDPATSLAYSQRYHANANPQTSELRVNRASGSQVLGLAETLQVIANESVELEVAWTACPTADACGDGVCGADETATLCGSDCTKALGCGGQERYVDLDRTSGELVVRREAMRLAWYATAGTYEEERTGVADDELDLASSRNGWRAPAQPGNYTLWVVLRDSRNGVGYRQIAVTVQ